MRILTVDDDEIALEMINQSLIKAGHQVESASNGQEAIDLLETNNFRMVITDWEMPQMDGLELCRTIRTQERGGYVYTILLTAHDNPQEVVEGLEAGADDFITKPFNPAELNVRVRAGERILTLETRDVAIFAMAKLAESRDPETGAHLERVQNYCAVLVDWLSTEGKADYQRDQAYRKMIFLTSPLHDIGKIGIPDCVLLKPGRLSDREFEIMKSHTTLGAETLGTALNQFPDATFLHMANDIAATHHEHFDGTGYPTGLGGDNIPLCGRIVALADVYDALVSKRVYKNALGHDLARSIIIEESGTHFDPEIVEAFLSSEDKFIEIKKRFSEMPVAVG